MVELGEFPDCSEQFYDILQRAELGASSALQKDLENLVGLVRTCFACGISLTDLLPTERGLGVRMGGAILKRCLTDLRAVWVLISIGYTSQAASVAAGLVEGALAAAVVSLNDAHRTSHGRSPCLCEYHVRASGRCAG